MVKTAVILAAGMGTRLGSHTKEKPKAFLEVGGKSLIKRSLDNLLSVGIEHIVIGTGYLKEHFEELKSEYPMLSFVHNPIYADTSSMYTLFLMRETLKEDFLLLESDLLYSPKLLMTAIEAKDETVVVSSGFLDNGDEVYLEVNETGSLVNVSKKKTELNSIHSILTGVSKISSSSYKSMCEQFSKNMDSKMKEDYELVLSQIGKNEQVSLKKVEDTPWCEIDDENHLQYAIENVLPRL